jgi:hypothetical protein
MVGTMVPIVYGARDHRAYGVVVSHTVGLILGSLLLGVTAWWTFGLVFGASRAVDGELVLSVVAALYALHHLGALRLPIPSLRWQVPARWRGSKQRGWVAFAYGLGLGVGLLTHVQTASLYFAGLLAAVSPDAATAGFIMAAFGLARAIPLIVFVWRADSAERAFSLNDTVLRYRAVMATANGVMLFTLAGAGLSWYLQSTIV